MSSIEPLDRLLLLVGEDELDPVELDRRGQHRRRDLLDLLLLEDVERAAPDAWEAPADLDPVVEAPRVPELEQPGIRPALVAIGVRVVAPPEVRERAQ